MLLEAGLFDEWLPSCTDRDLCIRIAELPGVRYGVTSEPTVHCFACESRPRLSAPGSRAQAEGLDRFFRKYRGRMSGGQQAEFRARAERLFGWKESSSEPANGGAAHHGSPSLLSSEPGTTPPACAPPHLIVGMIAGAERVAEVRDLLADLRRLAEEPGLSGLDVLLLENGRGRTPSAALRALVERERELGLRLHLVDRARHLEDAADGLVLDGGASKGCKLPTAPARTVLQNYLYAFAKRRPGAVVWIVDDDMRLDPLVVEEGGQLRRRRLNLVPVLRELLRLRASGTVDIAIGTCTGAPPVPFAATVRVQLVDLVATLWWLASQDPRTALPDRGAENAALRSDRRDYYYDLSRDETDRLETPFRLTPAVPGENVGEAFVRMAGAAERILAGEQVFRPLAIEAGIAPLGSISAGLLRGGNAFVLDIEALRLAPNPSPVIDGRPCRRSEMVWALLQERYFGRRVVTLPIALHHDRSRVRIGALDVERIVDDIRGHAIFSALRNTPGVFTATDDPGIELTGGTTERIAFADRVHEYLEERLAAFRFSFHRIRGLTRVLRRLAEDEEFWWQTDEYRAARNQLRAFSDRLADDYRMETLHRVERETRALNARRVHGFLERLPVEIEDHRNRLSNAPALAPGLESERIANARVVAARLAAPAGPLTVLGCGMEGVALSDRTRVFKVYDYYWKLRPSSGQHILRTQMSAWSHTRCLYPILDLHESGHHVVQVYPFEPSEPYIGGHGPGMVELLAECLQHGFVCENIKPDNLRMVDGRVRLIDYGLDVHLLESEREFVMMCRRAWLSYRWAHRSDLEEIMVRALDDTGTPEFDGFERFHEAVALARAAHRGQEAPDEGQNLDLPGGLRG